MSFVLDSSVALSWCLPDEEGAEAAKILEEARRSMIFVPALWHIEVANILRIGIRKGRLSTSDVDNALAMLATFDLHTDTQEGRAPVLLDLMKAYSLTAYDASYLDLALRFELGLAILDLQLARAARQAGVALLCQPS